MDMKRHMLKKIHVDSYKMEIIIKKGDKQLIMKINRKKNSYEIVKLENGAIISEFETIYGIVGMVQG